MTSPVMALIESKIPFHCLSGLESKRGSRYTPTLFIF